MGKHCGEEKFKVGDKVVLYKGTYDKNIYTVNGFLGHDTSFVFLEDENGRVFIENEDNVDLKEKTNTITITKDEFTRAFDLDFEVNSHDVGRIRERLTMHFFG